jgi:hypothetical protein
MSSIPANEFRMLFKGKMTAADRATFNRWLLGVSGFYACIAVLVIGAIAVGRVGYSKSQQAAAKVTPISSSLTW